MRRIEYPDIDALADGFADYAAEVLSDALARRKTVSLVVPGGNTPRHYLPELAAKQLSWRRITITLSDERWVDIESEDSNEHLVRNHLLKYLPEKANFVGLKTRHDTPADAIPEIRQRLEAIPQPFTLTVLGLGEDGHIASLFPGLTPEAAITGTTESCCIAVNPPIAPSPRVSLTLAALAGSEQIALVVTGKNKRRLLDRLTARPNPEIPLVWLLQCTQSPVVVFESD